MSPITMPCLALLQTALFIPCFIAPIRFGWNDSVLSARSISGPVTAYHFAHRLGDGQTAAEGVPPKTTAL
jgi:hypothetical protein